MVCGEHRIVPSGPQRKNVSVGRTARDRRPRMGLATVLLVVAWLLMLLMLPLPARAHDGHGAVPLASDEVAGPFVVSVWLVANTVDDTDDLYVVVRGETRAEVVEAVDSTGGVLAFAPWTTDGVWLTTLTASSLGDESLEIILEDDAGQSGVLVVSTLAPTVPGMNWIVLILLAQAAIALGWLIWRARHVWSRERSPKATKGVGDSLIDSSHGDQQRWDEREGTEDVWVNSHS